MTVLESNYLHKDIGFEGQQSFAGIRERLGRIAHPFLETLSSVVQQRGYEDEVFTGAGLCAVASYALLDGIQMWIPSAYTLAVKGMNIFMNKEYMGGVGMYKEAFGFHSILEMTHPDGEVMYADSTHGQLNKAWAGRFLFSTIFSLGDGYTTTDDSGFFPGWRHKIHMRPITLADLYDVTSQKDVQLSYFEKKLGITRQGYGRLVDAAGGGI